MIVKMKKVTLFLLEKEKDDALHKLRKLGVLHIKNIKSPVSEDISLLEQKISNVEKVINFINSFEEIKAQKETQNPEQITKRFIDLLQGKEKLLNEKYELESLLNWYERWGKVSIGLIKELQKYGVYIKLYTVEKGFLKKLPEEKNIVVVGQDKFNAYIVLFGESEDDHLDLKEELIPQENPNEVYKRYGEVLSELEKVDKEIFDLTAYRDSIAKYKEELLKQYEFNLVRYGMGAEEKICFLQGFCPVDTVPGLKKRADKEGWGYIVEEPDVPEEVPTLIRNPRWIRIIDPVFKFMGTLPGYNEVDISFWFLLFFSIFFAMLIGDAGYGIVFLLGTYLLRRKYKKAPAEAFILFYVLSITTIIWGAVTGTWFGYEKIARLPFFKYLVVDRVNSFIDENQNFMMFITFVIGVIQLSIAHLITALKYINSLRSLSEIGWVLILWGLFFVAGNLVLGKPLPGFTAYLFIAGALLAALFANPKGNLLKGFLAGIGDLPLSIISAFSDIVSYLRLFAVGYATVIVASSFNDMALGAGISGPLSALIAAMVLVFGHGLNIVLGLMAVIVHGIRLNMLEFSGHLNMQWSGKPYKPFRE